MFTLSIDEYIDTMIYGGQCGLVVKCPPGNREVWGSNPLQPCRENTKIGY